MTRMATQEEANHLITAAEGLIAGFQLGGMDFTTTLNVLQLAILICLFEYTKDPREGLEKTLIGMRGNFDLFEIERKASHKKGGEA